MLRGKFWLLLLIAVVSLGLTACELPSPNVGDVQVLDSGETTDADGTGDQTADEAADSGGEEADAGQDGAAEDAETDDSSADSATDDAGEDSAADDSSEDSAAEDDDSTADAEEDDAADAEDAAEEGETAGEDTTPRPQDDETADDDADDAAADDEAGDDQAAETEDSEESTDEAAETTDDETEEESSDAAESEETTTATPGVHIVAAGENLYRIGLQYGVSWTTLATFNNIANANSLQVGQEINIPAAGTTEPETPDPAVTPTPTDETVYVVQPGDNLFLIGLQYGLDWTQIAEANGLVNPNFIEAGQVLKIPTDQPGTSPEFTHVVAPGETLFLISLRYGVTWPTIAEKNEIEAPYVIYVGQPLVIPAGQ